MTANATSYALVRTEDEAAERILSNRRTMARWRSQGVGPKFIKIGRRVCYRDSDLEAWLDRQTRTSTAQNRDRR